MPATPNSQLLAALRNHSPKTLAAYESLPPSHRKRWLEHIAEAKKPETRARRIERCIAELSKHAPSAAPSGAAGYSGTPLPQKLGVKPDCRLALINAPKPLPDGLRALPSEVDAKTDLRAAPFDVIVLFAESAAALAARFEKAARALKPAGGLWIAWPKRASGVPTDLTEDRVRDIALAAGLVDNKVCAIDETWSGLRCVYRVKDRP